MQSTIHESPCAKEEFLLCPRIQKLYQAILELHNKYILYYDQICSMRKIGIGLDKVRIQREVQSKNSRTKLQSCKATETHQK